MSPGEEREEERTKIRGVAGQKEWNPFKLELYNIFSGHALVLNYSANK
jgi:hypothetical protein